MESYKTLEKIFYKINDINQAKSVLHWDSAVVMPSGGAEARANQLATLSSIAHAILTDPGVKNLIDSAGSKGKKLNSEQEANLREMKRLWKHANAVPQRLVKDLVKEGSNCEMVWRTARAENNFNMLKPHLKKVVGIVREIAKIKSEAFGCSPYEALLDQYDPSRKEAQLDAVFEDLKVFIPDFIQQVVEKQKSSHTDIDLKGPFPIEKQKILSNKMLEILGFDLKFGRLDESHHPFCGGYPSDVRITTRYNENDFLSSLMSVAHETGHATYEKNLPSSWIGQPVGEARGMSIHESQSLIIEMQVCRSKEFLEFLVPVIKKELGIKNKNFTPEGLYQVCTKVQPSLIRVDADEVTYPAHIMLRYYMEKYLISGDMEVDDLPDAWAQGMEKFIGVMPDNDKDGCMQDIHWMDGTFGYFPTYSLGAIHAAQFFTAIKAATPDLSESLRKGDISPVTNWLKTNVHEKGSLLSTEEIVSEATGKSIDLDVYKNYLKERYLA